MKIAYEKHPVSKERKEELRSKGFKIIDARFKPKGEADKTPRQAAKTAGKSEG